MYIWGNDGSTLTLTGTATVSGGGNGPVRPAPKGTGTQATATHGVAFKGNVATFIGSIIGGTASNYTASINWGDGHTTSGIIRPTGNNNFSVYGTNTFAAAGVYTVKITIKDSNGASTVVTTTITVADAVPITPDDDDTPPLIDDPFWKQRRNRLVLGPGAGDDLLQTTSSQDVTTTADPTLLGTDGDIIVVTPDYGVLVAEYDGDTKPADRGPGLDRPDAPFVTASDARSQDDDSTTAKVDVAEQDEADTVITMLDDLVTLPVAIVDELFATLWPS
jgi:hypothetical protein